MKVTVLGSGQDGGLPQIGSAHPNDIAARGGEIPERTASSLLVELADSSRLVLDVSPDFRVQWWPFEGLPDAVALTHAHMGHYAGLVHLGTEAGDAHGTPCFVTASMAAHLRVNHPWSRLVSLGSLDLRIGLVHEWQGHDIELIPVPHREEFTDTVGVSINGQLLYLPDIDDWNEWPEAAETIGRHRIAFVDGTFWSDNEVPGRNIEDIPHPLVPDTLQLVENLETRVILTHLNHTNPLCDPTSPETEYVLERGVEIAHDGLTVVV